MRQSQITIPEGGEMARAPVPVEEEREALTQLFQAIDRFGPAQVDTGG